MNDNLNPYKILGVSKYYDLDELKQKYKLLAKKVHPDKGGSEQLFKLVTLCYKKLAEEYKLKRINKQFNELKTGFSDYKDKHQSNTTFNPQNIYQNKYQKQKKHSQAQPVNFKDMFNKIYDDNKIHDAFDDGYGRLMHKSDPRREDINIEKKVSSMKNFNNTFENQNISKINQKMIVYKEPIALPTSHKTLKYAELGVDKINDYSDSSQNLECMDYRKAHSTSRLIDPRLVKQRDDYRNLGAIESARSNISYQMSEEDILKEALEQKKQQLKEQKRIEKQKQMDKLAEQKFNLINQLMLQYKK